MRVPSFAPAGTFTWYRRVTRSRPVPWQFLQGVSTITPFPRQRWHGCDNAKRPWLSEITPEPWQSGHVRGAVPGSAPVPPQTWQAVSTSTGTRIWTPFSASSNEMRTRDSRSPPALGPRAAGALLPAPEERPEVAEDV
jgi:hypothetical protein